MAPGFQENLARRLATAALALPLLLLLVLRGPAGPTLALVAACLALAMLELFRMLEARGLRPLRLSGLAVGAALFLEVAIPGGLGVPLWPLAALLLLGGVLRRGLDQDGVLAAAATLLGAFYLGALGGSIAGLRLMKPEADGAWRLTLLLATVMASDTVAFFVGHAVGRRRLAPRISPGKTLEGAVGGLAGGVAGSLAVRALGLPGIPLAHAVALGAAVAAMGVLGDLEESLLKRWAGVKDSGTLLPGHGGMLDRLDSLLFAAPVLYYYFLYVP